VRGLVIREPPQNGGPAFHAATGRWHINFNLECSIEDLVRAER
jgi:hypothetical protein